MQTVSENLYFNYDLRRFSITAMTISPDRPVKLGTFPVLTFIDSFRSSDPLTFALQYHNTTEMFHSIRHIICRQTDRQTQNTTSADVVGQRNNLDFSVLKQQHY